MTFPSSQTLSENAVRKRQDDAKMAELQAKLKKLKEQVGGGAEGGEEDSKEEVDDLLSSLQSAPLSDKTARLIGGCGDRMLRVKVVGLINYRQRLIDYCRI